MHRCVISTMFGWCFWFFKKTFLFKQSLVPPFALVLRISHSGSLACRPPLRGPSHFPLWFFTLSTPSPSPSHFPLRFFNPSSPPALSVAFPTPILYPVDPPCPVLRISHSGSLPGRPPSPSPSHFPLQFFNLSVRILENPTWTKEPSVPFISTTLPSWWFSWKNCHFVGRFFVFDIILRPITMYQNPPL